MVEQYGKVLGDRGEGVGGSIVETLNGRGEFFQPKIVQHIFYQLELQEQCSLSPSNPLLESRDQLIGRN